MAQTFSTADIYDSFADSCSSCETQFKQYGRQRTFAGRIRTVKCIDDNVLLRRALESRADGDVLIVDGGGFLGSALLGDRIATAGAENGWLGAIIFGAVRDSRALSEMDFGVKALGSNPRRSQKLGAGTVDVPVAFGGSVFIPGYWVYSDDDGILVSSRNLLDELT